MFKHSANVIGRIAEVTEISIQVHEFLTELKCLHSSLRLFIWWCDTSMIRNTLDKTSISCSVL